MSREREPDEAALEIRTAALPLVRLALAEDFGAAGDVTSNAIVPPTATAAARLVARKAGVLAGLEVARLVFEQVNPDIIFESHLSDGAPLAPDQVVAVLSGPARGLLAGERTALNFIQRLWHRHPDGPGMSRPCAVPGCGWWTRARRRPAIAASRRPRCARAAAAITASASTTAS
jgi:hypothetical protein